MSPTITGIAVARFDLPLRHPIRMSFGDVRVQNIVLVRLRDSDGGEGHGEASVLGGPYWGVESAEGVEAAILTYLAPALRGMPLIGLNDLASRLAGTVRGNAAARSAIEMAALDLLGRRNGVTAVELLGGRCRDRVPLAWTLSTGSTASDIEEGERAIAERGHRRFKLKLRRETAAQDVARAIAIVEAFRGRATVIADVNQAWDAVIAARHLPRLAEAGLEAIEQPLPADQLDAAARLRTSLTMEWIADEVITGPDAAFRVAARGAASCIALKPNRDGGIVASAQIAAIARSAGLGLYGGSMLETSLATAASLHLFASVPELGLGCELFGPLRLVEDVVTSGLAMRDGALLLPEGVGLGIEIDEDRIVFLGGRNGHGWREAA